MSDYGTDRGGRVPEDPVNPAGREWEEAGLPAQEDSTEEANLPTADRDGPTSTYEVGTTGTEREAGESHDEALAREEPDVFDTGRADPGGPPGARGDEPPEGMRPVEPDEGARTDDEPQTTARDADGGEAPYAPEEQALHEEDRFGPP